ncbi:MAG: DUF6265 family protein [Planctomycetota bacterium]
MIDPRSPLALLSLLLVSWSGFAAAPAKPRPPVEASIEDFAWLAGSWRGTGLGGACEEMWSAPMAGTMMGCFRLVRGEEVAFYEMLMLGQDEEGFALKVKHFTADFTAWEEKADCVRFALESVEDGRADFKGLKLRREGNVLEIEVRLNQNGEVRWHPLRFELVVPEVAEGR